MPLLLRSVDSLDACIYAEIRTRIPDAVPSWDFNFKPAVSNRYKYKFLLAMTANLPSNAIKEYRGSKTTIGRGGIMKVQHLVSVARSSTTLPLQQPSRFACIEFCPKPEENIDACYAQSSSVETFDADV